MKKSIMKIKSLGMRRVVVVVVGIPSLLFLMVATAFCSGCACTRQLARIWRNEA